MVTVVAGERVESAKCSPPGAQLLIARTLFGKGKKEINEILLDWIGIAMMGIGDSLRDYAYLWRGKRETSHKYARRRGQMKEK